MAKVTLFLRVKQDGTCPYYPASVAGNGRIDPLVAVVNGRRKTFDSGLYYLRFTDPDDKQKFTSAGRDPAATRAKQLVKQTELDAEASGVEVTLTDPTRKKGTTLADSIAKYVAFVKDNRRKKTWKFYTNDLRYFANFCSEHGIKTVDELGHVGGGDVGHQPIESVLREEAARQPG